MLKQIMINDIALNFNQECGSFTVLEARCIVNKTLELHLITQLHRTCETVEYSWSSHLHGLIAYNSDTPSPQTHQGGGD